MDNTQATSGERALMDEGVSPASFVAVVVPVFGMAALWWVSRLLLAGLATRDTTSVLAPLLAQTCVMMRWLVDILVVIGALYASALAVTGIIRLLSHRYILTDHRLIARRGLLSQITDVADLARIEQVTVVQTLLGHLLGYGTVELRTAGHGHPIRLFAVANPHRWVDAVEAARSSAKGDMLGGQRGHPSAESPSTRAV